MFTSAAQLKGWINKKSKETGTHATELQQYYFLERFLERMSLSPYRENMILKGGFLIAAMIGVDKRSTMDIDTTMKGMRVDRMEIERVLRDIIAIDVGDGVIFEIIAIRNIHDISVYDNFRVSLLARLFTLRVSMSIDITTGDAIIPHEIEHRYKMMFEDRTISVMAYNLNTILSEKLETILVRSVGNTRGRDFYDVFILLSTNRDLLIRQELLHAISVKAQERGSLAAIENHSKVLSDIAASLDFKEKWDSYTKRYHYA